MHRRPGIRHSATLAAWAIVALPALHATALSGEPDAREVEIAWVGERGPRRLTLAVEVGGKPLAALWDETIASLLRYYDRDGDAVLDVREAARLPSAFGLRQLTWGLFRFDGPAPPPSQLDGDGDGEVGAAELSAYYRGKGVGPALVGLGTPPFTARLDAALLKGLDADRDGTLAEAEVRGAETLLDALDRNGDERLTAEELVPSISYPGTYATAMLDPGRPAGGGDLPLRLLPPGDDVAGRPAEILAGRLGLEADAGALRDWRGGPPDYAWTVRLDDELGPGLDPDRVRHVPSAARGPWRTAREGDVVLHLRSDEGTLAESLAEHRKLIVALFLTSDDDSDRRVTDKELEDPARAPLVLARSWADRDGDQALSREELDGWLELIDRLTRGRVLISLLDHGRGLFEAIDADHDGGLSVRELRSAASLLRKEGCLVDGILDPARLPRTLIGCVSLGHPRHPLGARPASGPGWFDAMDRNRDGDISAREWVGDASRFRDLDADRDGLLGPEEAAGKSGVRRNQDPPG